MSWHSVKPDEDGEFNQEDAEEAEDSDDASPQEASDILYYLLRS